MIEDLSTDTPDDSVNAIRVYKGKADEDEQIWLHEEVKTADSAREDSDWR